MSPDFILLVLPVHVTGPSFFSMLFRGEYQQYHNFNSRCPKLGSVKPAIRQNFESLMLTLRRSLRMLQRF